MTLTLTLGWIIVVLVVVVVVSLVLAMAFPDVDGGFFGPTPNSIGCLTAIAAFLAVLVLLGVWIGGKG